MRFGCGSDVVQMWFERGSDVGRRWLGRVFGSGAASLAEDKGRWLPAPRVNLPEHHRPKIIAIQSLFLAEMSFAKIAKIA